ncbi:hypothetical protein C7212DRAFT_26153, partial [Tuber magnatum]
SFPKSADSDPISTEPSGLSQHPPIWPLSLWRPPKKTDPHHNPRLILSLTVGQYFITAFFVCILAFLVYILPSLTEIFPFFK